MPESSKEWLPRVLNTVYCTELCVCFFLSFCSISQHSYALLLQTLSCELDVPDVLLAAEALGELWLLHSPQSASPCTCKRISFFFPADAGLIWQLPGMQKRSAESARSEAAALPRRSIATSEFSWAARTDRRYGSLPLPSPPVSEERSSAAPSPGRLSRGARLFSSSVLPRAWESTARSLDGDRPGRN